MDVDPPTPTVETPPLSASATPPAVPETDEQKALRAENTKEKGNAAFKAKRYGEAIDLYTKAIGAYPSSASNG